MKKRLSVLILSMFLLSIFSVFAMQAVYQPINNEVFSGNDLSYTMKVTNDESSTLLIQFLNIDSQWSLVDETKTYLIEPGQSTDISLVFNPISDSNLPRTNAITLLIKDNGIVRFNKMLPYTILDYTKVLKAEFVESSIVNPLRGSILKLQITNQNKIALDDLNLVLKSPQFEASQTLSLAREGYKVLEFPITIDSNTIEGNYDANVLITYGEHEMFNTGIQYTVSKYESVRELIVPESRFLFSGETITETNEGNTAALKTYTTVLGSIEYKLASFNIEPTTVTETDDGYKVEWNINLQPGETKEFGYAINYRTPLLVVIVIILVFVGLYILRKRNVLTIEKRVLAMHETESGNLHVVKVMLNIHNRGSMAINGVRIIDKIPSIIKAPTQYGVFKPTSVKAMPEGTAMVWDIPSIRRGEEKVLAYRIEGKFSTMKDISLPPASVKYVMFGRHVSARSSSASLRNKK